MLNLILALTPFLIAGISVLVSLWKQTDTKPQLNQRVTGQPRDRKGRYANKAKSYVKHQVTVNHWDGSKSYFHI